MKILLCLFMLFSCANRRDLEPLQDALYELDTIYVDADFSQIQSLLDITEDDFKDVILLESLIVYEQKVLYIFQNPSLYLKEKLYKLDNYIFEYNNFIIYMNIYDLELLNLINNYLNKINV